jgi:hypothetical protein
MPELGEAFNPYSSGDAWHFFVSPTTIVGRPSR